jgi:hypothetical protein
VVRVAVQLLARSNRRAGCMTHGPGPPCLGALEVGGARPLGAVACRQHGCPPFHPLVWAKVEERL